MKLLAPVVERGFYATVQPAGAAGCSAPASVPTPSPPSAPAWCWCRRVAYGAGQVRSGGLLLLLSGSRGHARRPGGPRRPRWSRSSAPSTTRRWTGWVTAPRSSASAPFSHRARRGLAGSRRDRLHGGDSEPPCWCRTPGRGPRGWGSTARWGSRSGPNGSSGLGLSSLLVGAGARALVLEAVVAPAGAVASSLRWSSDSSTSIGPLTARGDGPAPSQRGRPDSLAKGR